MKQLLFFTITLLFLSNCKLIAQRTITGNVKDAQGDVRSAAVTALPSNLRTTTDDKGNFALVVKKTDTAFQVLYVGYEKSVTKLTKKNFYTIVLKEQFNQLNEIAIIGNNTVHKKNITGSVTYIAPTGEVSKNALAGRVAGLNVANANKVRPLKYEQPLVANSESYASIQENGFKDAYKVPLSTFSIDVDAASYTNVRRFINNGSLPPVDAVRTEEMINYFDYDYEQPKGNDPINIVTEIGAAPWNKQHKLLHIGLQAKTIPTDNLPASNLVFLIDVSGSMNDVNKLPLLVSSLKMLTDQLRAKDKVAIVVYAGSSGLVLPSTSGDKKTTIKDALNKLSAGGSTAGGAGLELAYKVANENFVKSGNNRIILATDGDFNVGESSDSAMEKLIEQKRKTGIYLTVLGYGMGNYKDSKMEILADKGNGNYAYIDNISEARKVLINEFGGTLFTIAKDVKFQLEFNPLKVQAYRLIGYENRLLNDEDFNDDKKDAGEMGSGHSVTAIYEIIPVGVKSDVWKAVDDLKYQKVMQPIANNSNELLTVKLRYKNPDGQKSKLIEKPVVEKPTTSTSENFKLSAAIAEFGMLLRQSAFKQNSNFDDVINLLQNTLGKDKEGYRSELLKMVKSAKLMAKEIPNFTERTR